MEFVTTGSHWLPEFSNKIKATCYSIVKSCFVVIENIVKSRFKINQASVNDYNYGKLRLSLKVVSL